jgi:hypothetical protein
VGQYAVLIRFWLKEVPADDPEAFVDQAASALWIEERCFKGLGGLFGGKQGKG